MSIIHAGGIPVFSEEKWTGGYRLGETPVYDLAKRFTSKMYTKTNSLMCLSFHAKKLLPLGKGGMMLTSPRLAVEWLKKARYEGRSELPYTDDTIDSLGWNMYMDPQTAARGLVLMQNYPENVDDLEEEGGYRDLTEFPIFKDYKTI